MFTFYDYFTTPEHVPRVLRVFKRFNVRGGVAAEPCHVFTCRAVVGGGVLVASGHV